jgi:hypothetical protein
VLGPERGLRQIVTDALAEKHRTLLVGLLTQQNELLAPEARHHIGRPLLALENVGQPTNDDVARIVAVRIVHALEVIDVDDQ